MASSTANFFLVGGLEHVFSIQLGMSSSQLTFTPSFFRGVSSNHQPVYVYVWISIVYIHSLVMDMDWIIHGANGSFFESSK
jgi:hypothetical protein